jgi:RNA polymerase sigma-70 factor (ECF subfamily)
VSPRDRVVAAAFAAHAGAVTAIAARVLGDADAARDVCQEAFVRLHTRLDEVRGEPGPWLRAVAWRLAFDAQRRESRAREARTQGRAPARTASLGDPSPLEDREEAARVREALEALSPRQREVLLLRVVDGETFPVVAHALAISEGSAKVHLRRALERLRALLPTHRHALDPLLDPSKERP